MAAAARIEGQYGLVEPPQRVHVFEDADGDWWAECLVCNAWTSTSNLTRRAAEQKFGRHLQNDHAADDQGDA